MAFRASSLPALALCIFVASACDSKSPTTNAKPEPAAKAAPTKAEPATKPATAANPEAAPSSDGKQEVAELRFVAPPTWTRQPPKNRMRVAQFGVPLANGAAELVVFRFPGGGGSVQANIDRWKSQFKPAAGKTIDQVTKLETIELTGLKITRVEIEGGFTDTMRPMAKPAAQPAGDSRMLAAIVEGSGNPFFFKMVGPTEAMATKSAAFTKMLRSMTIAAKP